MIQEKIKYLKNSCSLPLLGGALLLGVFFSFSSCSTDKNAFANKAYHYTTTRFNGYFHGKEALKEAQKEIKKGHKDDYEQILELFQYGDKQVVEGQYGKLNRAITKASAMIEKHSMKFKKKGVKEEVNKMMDDCYFLMGQAQFHKMLYDSSELTFKYIIGRFETGPLKYPATLELIKTFIYQENYVDAETRFKELDEDELFPEKLKDELNVLKALYMIRTEDYKEAIKYLKLGIPESKRKHKVRYKYVLAQLLEAVDAQQEASLLYEEVAKKAIVYEMEFNAKLRLAKTHQGSNTKIIAILNKMLKDGKNKEFRDQIYFTLAQVYEREGKLELAIENYKKSAASSVNNPKQKALSYLAVADHYFSIPEYVEAQLYYDSTMVSLPKTHPNYEDIELKASNLTELVEQLNTISREDSLQNVASMSEEDRTALIEKIIAQVEADEVAKEQAEAAKLEQIKAAAILQQNTGGWLFDNPTLLASANAEFIALYGNRKLEDNWRRSDKTSVSIEAFEEVQGEEEQNGEEKLAPNKTVDFYLKDLPFTEEAIAASNEKVEGAIYKAAVIFKEKLNDVPQSNRYFEMLNKRFTNNPNRAKSLYQLYRNYKVAGREDKANKKADILLAEFPQSEYALLIKYPNKSAEEEQLLAELNKEYEQLFQLYKDSLYDTVLTKIRAIQSSYKENSLVANFDLLAAFCVGQLQGEKAFETALTDVAKKHKGSVPGDDALALLNDIAQRRMGSEQQQLAKKKTEQAFDTSMVGVHYYAIVLTDSTVSSSELMKQIQLFNIQYYAKAGIKMQSQKFDEGKSVVILKDFVELGKLKDYRAGLRMKVLDKFNGVGANHFIISQENYSKLVKHKHLDDYRSFALKQYK